MSESSGRGGQGVRLRESCDKNCCVSQLTKNKIKYRPRLLLNYDTGHIPVNLRFQHELRRQIYKVKDFVTVQDQCSHTCLLQSRPCTKPAEASHFIFEWCWCWCIFPSKPKWFTLPCIWLKQNAAVFSRHCLPCINCSLSPLLHRQCAFHRRATSHSWACLPLILGSFQSGRKSLGWGRWLDEKLNYGVSAQDVPRNASDITGTVDILYGRGCERAGFPFGQA